MAAGIRHNATADGTFSGAGATNWNANHVFEETGGAQLTVGAITDGQFLKRSGTTITSGTPSGDILFADAPNQDFDLTNGGAGGAVTIISKSVTGIAAGDQIILEVDYAISNNSGGTRTYTLGFDLGSFTSSFTEGTVVAASATSQSPRWMRAVVSVSSTSLARKLLTQVGSNANTAGSWGGFATGFSGGSWDTSSSNLTGTQTLAFKVTSSAATTTQTLKLHNYTIRKISQVT